jgi:hypothetical protein
MDKHLYDSHRKQQFKDGRGIVLGVMYGLLMWVAIFAAYHILKGVTR